MLVLSIWDDQRIHDWNVPDDKGDKDSIGGRGKAGRGGNSICLTYTIWYKIIN